MIGYVYLTINDINNICYIGKRQKNHFDKAYKGSGTHLKLAFAKYGRELFHSYILEWCNTKEDLCKTEKKGKPLTASNGRLRMSGGRYDSDSI